MIRALAVLLVVALAMAVTGCSSRPVAIAAPRTPLPADMTSCPPEPDGRGVRDDAGIAGYLLDLAASGRACRARLDATRRALNSGH